MQAVLLPTLGRWFSYHQRPVARNLQLLLDTQLLVPARLQGRYQPHKKVRLRYHYDRQLELAQVAVVQGYQTIGYLPLPDAQLVYSWKEARLNFSFRLLQVGCNEQGSELLRLRVTMP
ncbi:MAG: hypothetical protein Q8J69_03125 [Sphingobacteriaceae bacterium]|nr:hypothetical protein [Sphingobacteriaceae bacterium]